MTNGAGKGDTPRPVNRKKYEENYQKIFNKEEDNNEEISKRSDKKQ